MIVPAPTIEEYRKFAAVRVEALNYALQGIPEDRVRYHICWGSWHGPHTHDLPLKHVIDLMLKVKAGAYSLEAANPRHEHEWKVWKNVKLPQGKILIPGVVSHASNVVEHPELVADRIILYAGVVGRENVIAGTDCGMDLRVHPPDRLGEAQSAFRRSRAGVQTTLGPRQCGLCLMSRNSG
jgi:5-methyltetrahydropteroyltriglutamate--homocysteine methyltransferase